MASLCHTAHRLLLLAVCAVSGYAACPPSAGTWVDLEGSFASVTFEPGGLVEVATISPQNWRTANGSFVNGTTAVITFNPGPTLTAIVPENCGVILWSNGQRWSRVPDDIAITTVHMVYMTHLDVGFTNLARNVCELYFQSHIPAAMATAAALRKQGGPPFAYTTHPFVVAEYLDAAMQCGITPRSPADIAALEAAIASGDIRWHGKFGNLFPELIDGPGFASSLLLAEALNAQFNVSWGATTVKSTDVPGLSRSVIPILAGRGRRAVHIGYNGACKVAGVPQVFNWVHPETNTSLLVFVNNNYGSIIYAPPHALVFKYQSDNTAPPSPSDVTSFWAAVVALFPNASVILSSLDEFAEAVLPYASLYPTVTQEIGDSWTYGAPADAAKLAAFREARRARNEAVAAGALNANDPNLMAYERRILIAGPEHNWGLSVGQYLPSLRTPGAWNNSAFVALRPTAGYQFLESGWAEKRSFLTPLPPVQPSPQWTAFTAELESRFAALIPAPPALTGYAPATAGTRYTCGRLSVVFNDTDGSLASLVDTTTGHDYGAQQLLAFLYQTYTLDDFNAFNEDYNQGCGPPCGDFSKAGMDSAYPIHSLTSASLAQLWKRSDVSQPCAFVSQLTLPPLLVSFYGGMQAIFMNVTLDADASSPTPQLDVTLTWFNKTATRLAEASWLAFTPTLPAVETWMVDVLGYPVDTQDVVLEGTQHVHGVWDGFAAVLQQSGGGIGFNVSTLDAPVISPGATNLLSYDGLTKPDPNAGVFVSLHNNLWGTAFPQWYDSDGLFRFVVRLGA